MRKTLIVLITIFIIIITIFNFTIKSNFMKSSKSSKQNIYDIAYELGVHYIDLGLYHEFKDNKLAVMFDIDDTLLKFKNDKPYPIQSIINLLNYSRSKGLMIVIITARDSRYINETLQQLRQFGIKYDKLYMRHDPKDNYQLFKSDIKKRYLEQENIRMIMSVGDNDIDIIGPYSGYCLKLPNISDPRLFHTNAFGQIENIVP